MRAVVYKGKNKVAVEEVPDPKIEGPTDAVIKISSAAICGSDLHMYEDRSSASPGCVFGHENQGVVQDVGPGVTSIKVGDRVVLPFNIACGFCFNCTRGWTSACLTMNKKFAGAGYGYADMGPYRGGQAEYLRVPYVDFNALKLPGKPGDEMRMTSCCWQISSRRLGMQRNSLMLKAATRSRYSGPGPSVCSPPTAL